MTKATIERATTTKRVLPEFSAEVIEAATEYIRLRDRITNPSGTFDRGGRFYLSDSERCDCCNTIRTPSRAYPYSEMVHARTAVHVASLRDVPLRDLRRAARKLDSC